MIRRVLTLLLALCMMTTLGLGLVSRPTSATTTSLTIEGKSGTVILSLTDLQGMEATQGQSSYQNSVGNWKGLGTYVGVNIPSLVNLVGNMEAGDTLTVYASDNYTQTYSYYNVFNAWPDASIQGSMILAYSFNGSVVPTWVDGFRIAFMPDDSAYSNADCAATTTPDESSGSAGARWVSSVSRIVVNAAPWTVTMKKDTSTMTYGGQQIANMTSVTASGGFRKSTGAIVGPDNYTGANVSYLLEWVGGMSPADSLKVSSRDGYQRIFNYNLAMGNDTVWTVLSYRINGTSMPTADVPRITFIGPSSPITNSNLWQKAVNSMEVIANQPPVVQPLANVSGFVNQQLTFNPSVTDLDSDALRCTWSFGDGTPLSVGQTMTHNYVEAGMYTFTVWVDDLTGLVGHNVSSSATASIPFNITLETGWNLVSLPLVGAYNASTLGLQPGDTVSQWNSSTKAYRSYIVGVPLKDFMVAPSTGFWVNVPTGTRTLTIYGYVPNTEQTVDITGPMGGGWSLVGFLGFKTRHASDFPGMWNGTGSVTILAKYSPLTRTYTSWLSMIPTVNDFLIEPGHAYWIMTSGSGTLTYTP
jgi:hypothetical protein